MASIVFWAIIVFIITRVLIKIVYSSDPSVQDADGYLTLTTEQAKNRLANEKDIILVDVRSTEEYAGGHLPKSILIQFKDLEAQAPQKLPDKDVPIFVYCTGGIRSRAASKKLLFLGYTKVFNIGSYELLK